MRRAGPLWADSPTAGSRLAAPLGRLARVTLGVAAVAVAGLAVASTLSSLAAQRTAAQGPGHGEGRAHPQTEGQGAGAWEEVREARPRFVLEGPEFGRAPDVYSVRRNVAGGGRLDQMAFGVPHAAGPYLRLTFYRPFDEPVAGVSFWLEMARRAGEAGLALERSSPVPELVRTRLGDFEVGVLRAVSAQGPRPCLGFRHQASEPDFMISGIACLDGEPEAARQALVCILDAIGLSGGQDDPELAAFFERAGPGTCGPPAAAPARLARQGRR